MSELNGHARREGDGAARRDLCALGGPGDRFGEGVSDGLGDRRDLDAVRALLGLPEPSLDTVVAGRARLTEALARQSTAGEHEEPAWPDNVDGSAWPDSADGSSWPDGADGSSWPDGADGSAPGRSGGPARSGASDRPAGGDARRPGGPRAGRRPWARGRRRWPALGAAAATAATILAGAAIVWPGGPATPAGPPAAGPSVAPTAPASAAPDPRAVDPRARKLLLVAADAAEKAPANGVYWRTTRFDHGQVLDPGGTYVLERRRSEQTWLARRPGDQSWRIHRALGASPATAEDRALWRAAGSPSTWKYPAPHNPKVTLQTLRTEAEAPAAGRLRGKWVGSGGDLFKGLLTWEELSRIPDTPDGLRAYLEAGLTQGSRKPANMDEALREQALHLIVGVAVSPKVRAAAYRVLAGLPGMRAGGETVDALGRRGQALDLSRARYDGERVAWRLLIDPDKGLILARETTSAETTADGRRVELRHSTAYQAVGWTKERPELPARRE
ncbi:hypothetical protein FHU36_002177 [Nonomuraea muscovyensis]|uniref:CU044_5270 family protein n=1 Tax=Nonomuraea muscovyensis TaxID=1124761 RepID=A0A7X0BZX7_9ACTN|nr:hypothetical protein [Nonomuraea muscovyensis]MBB6345668.1 hypothetical protein [Nonomuraea muscovyensis]